MSQTNFSTEKMISNLYDSKTIKIFSTEKMISLFQTNDIRKIHNDYLDDYKCKILKKKIIDSVKDIVKENKNFVITNDVKLELLNHFINALLIVFYMIKSQRFYNKNYNGNDYFMYEHTKVFRSLNDLTIIYLQIKDIGRDIINTALTNLESYPEFIQSAVFFKYNLKNLIKYYGNNLSRELDPQNRKQNRPIRKLYCRKTFLENGKKIKSGIPSRNTENYIKCKNEKKITVKNAYNKGINLKRDFDYGENKSSKSKTCHYNYVTGLMSCATNIAMKLVQV